MIRLLIVAWLFLFAGLVVSYMTHGRPFKVNAPDPPKAQSSVHADPPSTVRVLINGQVWTCRMEHGSAKGCTLTYSQPARLHS